MRLRHRGSRGLRGPGPDRRSRRWRVRVSTCLACPMPRLLEVSKGDHPTHGAQRCRQQSETRETTRPLALEDRLIDNSESRASRNPLLSRTALAPVEELVLGINPIGGLSLSRPQR
jgi:hypothetical protein